MQIIIFTEISPYAIEKRVNVWLTENKDKKIIYFQSHVVAVPVVCYSITIAYKKNLRFKKPT
jgi:hypothetical protein